MIQIGLLDTRWWIFIFY